MYYLTHAKNRSKLEDLYVIGLITMCISMVFLFTSYGMIIITNNHIQQNQKLNGKVSNETTYYLVYEETINSNSINHMYPELFSNQVYIDTLTNTEKIIEEIEPEIIQYFENDYLNNLHDEIFAIEIFENYNKNSVSRDLYLLLQIVHAESGNQPIEGRSAVAEVIFNRINSDSIDFKNLNTVEHVIMVKGQFSPVSSGSIYTATVDDITFEAVKIALTNSNYAKGAHFFFNPSIVTGSTLRWFNTLEFKIDIADHQFRG